MRIQVRCTGTATILAGDDGGIEDAWSGSAFRAQRCYAQHQAPSSLATLAEVESAHASTRHTRAGGCDRRGGDRNGADRSGGRIESGGGSGSGGGGGGGGDGGGGSGGTATSAASNGNGNGNAKGKDKGVAKGTRPRLKGWALEAVGDETPEDAEARARSMFATVVVEVEETELLYIASSGHRRVREAFGEGYSWLWR